MTFLLDYRLLIGVQLIWITRSVVWLIKRDDALPFVISGFLFYVFGFRLWALLQGYATPVLLTPFGLDTLDYDTSMSAFLLELLGQTILLLVYMRVQTASFKNVKVVLADVQGSWMRTQTMTLAILCLPVVIITRAYIASQAAAGLSLAFEVSSYAFLFPFVMNSIAILLVMLWKTNQLPGVFWKTVAAILLAIIAYLSFGSTGRFLFLGWMLAATFIFMTGLSASKRLLVLFGGVLITAILFGVAGALRSDDTVSDEGLGNSAFERVFSAEDANMLDGLVFLRQVYPTRLPYSLGGEHLGILLRPIPRSLWPDKPVGGYINQLGLVDADSGFSLGISPSLIGDFYQEGGWIGIIVLAIVYGWGLGRIVRYSAGVNVFAGTSIRVILYAFAIPLFRGGDLPGIYAWLGMAFWPYALLFWLHRRDWFAWGRIRKPRRGNMRPRPIPVGKWVPAIKSLPAGESMAQSPAI